MDWYSRYVLSWEPSTSLEADFCVRSLEKALSLGRPENFNTDQGSQFTSRDFTKLLLDEAIFISMDGRGRCMDNIFTERFWRSLKYENVYPNDYQTVREARTGIGTYFHLYNTVRLHQSLGYMTPYEVYMAQGTEHGNMEKKKSFPAFPCYSDDDIGNVHKHIQGCNLRMVKNCLDNRDH